MLWTYHSISIGLTKDHLLSWVRQAVDAISQVSPCAFSLLATVVECPWRFLKLDLVDKFH